MLRAAGLAERLTRTGISLDLRQSPFVRFLILHKERVSQVIPKGQHHDQERGIDTHLVVQRLDLFLLLPLTDLIRIRDPEELRGDLDEPFGLDRRHVMTVLARCQDKLVVYAPFGVAVEQCGGRVDVYRRALNEGFVPFLGILLRCVPEEP